MASLDLLLPRIRPLIRLFNTDNDHEAVGALRALGRVLEASGFNYHDLADAVGMERAEVKEIVAHGDEYWQPPKPKRGNNDFVEPKRQRPPPKPSGPPIWEKLGKTGRLAWLDCALTTDKISSHQKTMLASVRAQLHSQPQIQIKAAQRTAINEIFGSTWIADVRPIADIVAGDRRLPITWTGKNKGQVCRVLKAALPHLEYKDRQFVGSILRRMEEARSALATPSTHDVETIDRLLVEAYDLGARP